MAIPLAVALFGPIVADLAPSGRGTPFSAASWSPFGTDRLGRDVLVAALEGGRSLLAVTVSTVLLTYLVGLVIGLLAAAVERPWLEDLIMRPIDVLLCLPSLLIIMVAALRSEGSPVAVAVAVGLALLAPITRFVRMAAREVVRSPVMDALRMQGESLYHRYGRYAARELARPIAADLGVRFSTAIYFVASANFLGLGFDPTGSDWAVSVATNKDGLAIAPWSVLLPASLIVLLVVGVNLLWDEILADPRLVATRSAVAGNER